MTSRREGGGNSEADDMLELKILICLFFGFFFFSPYFLRTCVKAGIVQSEVKGRLK
jgi:hypothetical protein